MRPPITASESVVSGDVILPTNSQTGVQDVAAEQSTCQLKPALAIYSRYLAKQGRGQQAGSRQKQRKEGGDLGQRIPFSLLPRIGEAALGQPKVS